MSASAPKATGGGGATTIEPLSPGVTPTTVAASPSTFTLTPLAGTLSAASVTCGPPNQLEDGVTDSRRDTGPYTTCARPVFRCARPVGSKGEGSEGAPYAPMTRSEAPSPLKSPMARPEP